MAKKSIKPKNTAPPSAELTASDRVHSSYITGNTFGMKEVQYAEIEGNAIFEGDIVLGIVEEMVVIKRQVEHPFEGVEFSVVISGN